jgi:hypothetical protein
MSNLPDFFDGLNDDRDIALEIALQWVYKIKWSSKHKISGNEEDIRNQKPVGEILLAWLSLCESLHGFTPDTGFCNGGEWFRAVCLEIKRSSSLEIGPKMTSRENPFDQQAAPIRWRVAQSAIGLRTSCPIIFDELWIGRLGQKRKGLGIAIREWERRQ